jgi:hypothetical protein
VRYCPGFHLIAPNFANAIDAQLGIDNLAQYPTWLTPKRTQT